VVKKGSIKIVLAEDHAMFRQALASMLNFETHFNVVGEVGNGRELMTILKSVEPDILLMDIEMPVMNGHEAFHLIRKKHPDLRIIIVSMYDDDGLVSEFISAGARAYLTKDTPIDQLFAAINKVYNEGFYFNDKTSKALVTGMRKEKNNNSVFDELSLTKREIDVLKTICAGKTNVEISKMLNISASTVDFHRKNIYKKTKCNNVADVIKYAIKHGFLNVG